MASEVGICNSALVKLGARTIMALDDTSKESRLCKARYTDVRDEVLRAHPWNFAVKRASLAQLSTTPAFGFSKGYQLPNDCLRVLRLSNDESEYQIEGRHLLSNAGSVKLVYIAQVSDPNLYDALFINALSFRLAAELAYPLANNRELTKTMQEMYQDALRQARSVDATEGTANALYDDTFIEVRL